MAVKETVTHEPIFIVRNEILLCNSMSSIRVFNVSVKKKSDFVFDKRVL